MDDRPGNPPARTPRRIRLGEQDLELLWFLAEHRMVLADHAATLLGVAVDTAKARLAKLAAGGYVRTEPLFAKQPAMNLITRAGLNVVGSGFPTPRIDVRLYEHDVGVAWLWLAARHGTFGPVREILAERRLRSHDVAREPGTEPFAVKRGGVGPRGGEQLHYPDLVLTTADGRRVALELELSSKGPTRLRKILAGYAADPRFDGVVYLVESAAVARSVKDTARRMGISSLVHIQRVSSTVKNPAAALAQDAARVAPRRRERGSERERDSEVGR